MSDGDDAGVRDSLSFLDLLYAVPIGDLAVRVSGADLNKVSFADWTTVGVCVTVIMLSWVGLHRNRREMAEHKTTRRPWIDSTRFWSPRFGQFILEVVIVILYFAMGLKLNLPLKDSHAVGSGDLSAVPDVQWIAFFLLLVFAAYLLWDGLDILLARLDDATIWEFQARQRSYITLIATLLAALAFVIVDTTSDTSTSAITWSLIFIVSLYVYRVAQESWLCYANEKYLKPDEAAKQDVTP